MTTKTCDCLCAGIIVADHVCRPVEHVPEPGERVLTPRMELSIGGCAANVAVDLTKLGVRASVVGRVGDDIFARFIKESLEAAGIRTQHVVESPECDTSGTLVINAHGQDRRFIHSMGANGLFTGDEITGDLIASSRIFYLGGYCLMDSLSAARVAELFRQARASGVATILDVVIPGSGDWWSRIAPILPFADVFLPNDDEARAITGLSEPRSQAAKFREAGAGTVVITCGSRGALLMTDRLCVQSASYAIDFVDGTGSGDAFSAGYIYGLLQGCDERKCLTYGSALGASCVRATGATTGVFDRRALEAFVAAHPLELIDC